MADHDRIIDNPTTAGIQPGLAKRWVYETRWPHRRLWPASLTSQLSQGLAPTNPPPTPATVRRRVMADSDTITVGDQTYVPLSRLEETEKWGKEAWAWLEDALRALGVPTVFDIPDTTPEDRELEAEARSTQLEEALRRHAKCPACHGTGEFDIGAMVRRYFDSAPTSHECKGSDPEEGA